MEAGAELIGIFDPKALPDLVAYPSSAVV